MAEITDEDMVILTLSENISQKLTKEIQEQNLSLIISAFGKKREILQIFFRTCNPDNELIKNKLSGEIWTQTC